MASIKSADPGLGEKMFLVIYFVLWFFRVYFNTHAPSKVIHKNIFLLSIPCRSNVFFQFFPLSLPCFYCQTIEHLLSANTSCKEFSSTTDFLIYLTLHILYILALECVWIYYINLIVRLYSIFVLFWSLVLLLCYFSPTELFWLWESQTLFSLWPPADSATWTSQFSS